MAATVTKVVFHFLFVFGSFCPLILAASPPNIVILLADDLGYGDLEVYGHPTSSTPNINDLAAKGLRFTQFYSTSPVCSPSRASLLTGRYQTRSGIWPGVFWPDFIGGLPDSETTIAELLKTQGYTTNIVGKWHLGVGKNNEHLPPHHGFDSYFGVPYSHDMCRCKTCFYPSDSCANDCAPQYTNCPLFTNTTLIEQPVDLLTLDKRYADHATSWIAEKAQEGTPFFLFLSFQHTHHPQYSSEQFRNTTLRGMFGDSLAAVDWTVGKVMKQLQDSGVDDNTFVFFTSDNGPALHNEERGGNAGLLKCGKGTTYEGGMRVPAIAHWPGRIKSGKATELACMMDLLPTVAKLAGATMPTVTIDGVDMSSILFSDMPKSQRDTFFYYYTSPDPSIGVYAVRYKQYKAHFYTQGAFNSGPNNHDLDCRPTANLTKHDPPLLYNLLVDPSEQYALNTTVYKDIVQKATELYHQINAQMEWGKSELKDHDPLVEPCCNKGCTPQPDCCHCGKGQGDSRKLENKYSKRVNKIK